MTKIRQKLHDLRFPAAISAAGISIMALATSCASTSYFSGPRSQALVTELHGGESCAVPAEADRPGEVIKVMTMNLAHGRKDGPNQLFQRSNRIQSNLDEVARVIERVDPHVVALQEADGPSGWSGGFDHINHLAASSAMPYSVRGDHVRGLSLAFGTAVCSRLPLYDGESHAFDAAPPMFTKGFVLTTAPWPDGSGRELDLVSVHLDFARASVRKNQVRRLAEVLASRPGPYIVMGDFNCDGAGGDDALAWFLRETGLRAFEHGVEGLDTFALLGKRLDWILISPELEFVSYKVLPDVISDHKAVASEIAWKIDPAGAG